jgi:hypothetical protein
VTERRNAPNAKSGPNLFLRVAAYGFAALLLVGIVVAHPLLSAASAILATKVALECQRRGSKTNAERFEVAVTVLGTLTRAIFRPLRAPYISISRWAFERYARAHVRAFREPQNPVEEKTEFPEGGETDKRANENGALPAFVFTRCGRYEALPVVTADERPTNLDEYASPEDIAILAENGIFTRSPPPKPRGRKRKSGKGE